MTYNNIRELLGCFVGRTIGEITQHDADEFQRDGKAFIQLTCTDGSEMRFVIGDDGMWSSCTLPDCPAHPDSDES